MAMQRAGLDLLQHLHGRRAAQLAHHALAMPFYCLHALAELASDGLVGEPQPHLLERGPLDLVEPRDLLLDRQAKAALTGSLRVFEAEALERIEECIVIDRLF